METAAVVVGAGINGLGVVRSLGRAGVPVAVVDSLANQPAMHSRYARQRIVADTSPGAVMQTLKALAARWPGQRPVLLLTQEEVVSAVAEHRDELAEYFALTMGPGEIVGRLLHKQAFRMAAEAGGFGIPRTLIIRRAEEIGQLSQLRPPLILKPAIRSAKFSERFRRTYRVEAMEDARNLLAEMVTLLDSIIVQEWIDGADSDIYFCLQYLPPGGDRAVSFVGRKLRSWPPRVGGTASCAPAEDAGELAGLSEEFFRDQGLHGLASMEYKRHAGTGEYLMIEPTVGRTDYQEEVATLNGINIPLAAYRGALGLTTSSEGPRSRAYIWRDRPADIKSAEANPGETIQPPVGARSVNALWRGSDPGPALTAFKERARQVLRRRLGGRNDLA